MISVNSLRKPGNGGGGKKPQEMLEDMRRTLATGSFVDLVEPTVTAKDLLRTIPIKFSGIKFFRMIKISPISQNIDYRIDLERV